MDKRLAAIEARAKDLGMAFGIITFPEGHKEIELRSTIFRCQYTCNKLGLHAAERLLSLHEPGATVKVSRPDVGGPCHDDCDFKCVCDDCMGGDDWLCAMDWMDVAGNPTAACISPDTYKLVPVGGGE